MPVVEGECQGKAGHFLGRCERKPIVVHDGKPYCWQHDPERLQKIAREKWEARKAEMARDDAEFERKLARRKLVEEAGTGDLSDDDLREIIGHGGIRNILRDLRGKQ
jgi:hypothetical protein